MIAWKVQFGGPDIWPNPFFYDLNCQNAVQSLGLLSGQSRKWISCYLFDTK